MHEKTMTPRSCLRWKSTGKIFKTVGLRWVPTGKIFTSSTTKVDSEPPNGSNEDITNPYECKKTLDVSASTLNLSAGLALQRQNDVCSHQFRPRSSMTYGVCKQHFKPRFSKKIKNDWDLLFCPMFDEYFNPSPSVVQHVLVAVVQEPVVSTGTPSSRRIDQDTPSTSTSQTTQEEQSHVIPTSVEDDDHGSEVAYMDNDLISAGRYLLQTLGQEKLEFLMKKVGMQSMSPETMKKLADETEELWCILQSRSIKCIFVGYPKETTGHYFYYPHKNKILVARNAEFFENDLTLQEASGSNVDLEVIRDVDTQPSQNTSERHDEVEHENAKPSSDIVHIRRSIRIP
ncbi:hypothetical protein Tco_0156066 [Tanacetum coccineum]